jgi:hypothetical protein
MFSARLTGGDPGNQCFTVVPIVVLAVFVALSVSLPAASDGARSGDTLSAIDISMATTQEIMMRFGRSIYPRITEGNTFRVRMDEWVSVSESFFCKGLLSRP